VWETASTEAMDIWRVMWNIIVRGATMKKNIKIKNKAEKWSMKTNAMNRKLLI